MLVDIRWIVLVLCALIIAVCVWLLPLLVAPVTIALAVAGLLYYVLRLDR